MLLSKLQYLNYELGMTVQPSNPHTWEVEAGESEIFGYIGLQNQLKINLRSIIGCFK